MKITTLARHAQISQNLMTNECEECEELTTRSMNIVATNVTIYNIPDNNLKIENDALKIKLEILTNELRLVKEKAETMIRDISEYRACLEKSQCPTPVEWTDEEHMREREKYMKLREFGIIAGPWTGPSTIYR